MNRGPRRWVEVSYGLWAQALQSRLQYWLWDECEARLGPKTAGIGSGVWIPEDRAREFCRMLDAELEPKTPEEGGGK